MLAGVLPIDLLAEFRANQYQHRKNRTLILQNSVYGGEFNKEQIKRILQRHYLQKWQRKWDTELDKGRVDSLIYPECNTVQQMKLKKLELSRESVIDDQAWQL